MLKMIKGWFGWVEHEISDVLSDFHLAIAKLEKVTSRKQEIARTKQDEATKAQAAAEIAKKHAEEAAIIRGKLRELISGSSVVADEVAT